MHSKPLIGMNANYYPPRKDEDSGSSVLAGYYDSVVAAGGVPVVIPPLTDADDLALILDHVDGILMTSGGDLNPKRLGVLPHPAVRPIPERREDSDRLLCQLVLDRQMPLLAVSLGMQLLNVICGGTLYMHIPEDLPRALPHFDPLGGPHRHALLVEPNTRVERIYGGGEIRVNSAHHQAVRTVASGFRVTAKAPDGVIEAIEREEDDWFCVGIQWHPQADTASALDLQVFEEFVTACTESQPALSLARN